MHNQTKTTMKRTWRSRTKGVAAALMMLFGSATLGLHAQEAGKRVTKEFVDGMTKYDASYAKKVKTDGKGAYYDMNAPEHTAALIAKDEAAKAKSKSASQASGKLEVAGKTSRKTSSAPARVPVKEKAATPAEKKANQAAKVDPSKEDTEGEFIRRQDIDKRIKMVKEELKNAKGADLERIRKTISELEELRATTYNKR
jgi:hypothetical protein